MSDWLRERLDRSMMGRVLDVGCGDGRYLSARAVGIDVDPARLRAARARSARVAVADAHHLPFRDGAFDTVLAIRMLNAAGAIDDALREMRRVLARDGLLLVYTRARRSESDDRLDADNGLERLRPFFSSVEVEREPGEARGALFVARR